MEGKMIPYPHINPDLIRIGPFHVRWYGVMYTLGFIAGYYLIRRQERAQPIGLTGHLVQELIFQLAIGLMAGARLGYAAMCFSTNIPTGPIISAIHSKSSPSGTAVCPFTAAS